MVVVFFKQDGWFVTPILLPSVYHNEPTHVSFMRTQVPWESELRSNRIGWTLRGGEYPKGLDHGLLANRFQWSAS
jgi:hypothetical protein